MNCNHGDEVKRYDWGGLYCWECSDWVDRSMPSKIIGFLNETPTRFDWLLLIALLALAARFGR